MGVSFRLEKKWKWKSWEDIIQCKTVVIFIVYILVVWKQNDKQLRWITKEMDRSKAPEILS